MLPQPPQPDLHQAIRGLLLAALYEKDLEQGLLDQLQTFLLELGKGFAFVARQKHLRVEGEDCFIDLVFYNYLLKCFVLVDLKMELTGHKL